jgi:surface carbohydrate biosynthesis protein
MPPTPALYFLIEETARELASRVLLCTVATEQGLSSCIIPQWLIWNHFERLAPGIVIFKGNNTVQTNHMLTARKAGHLVASIEEEALGLSLDREVKRLFDPRTADACDLILAQGECLRAVVTAKDSRLADMVVVTGNPRIDLLRPPFSRKVKAQAEEFRRVHGDYVLINSNFGSINPRVEDTYAFYSTCIQVGVITEDEPKDRADFLEWCGWERANLDLLTEVIGSYLDRPKVPRLIIRPHPSENAEKWRKAYQGVAKVSIIREGDHLAWTAAANLLIHTGCTTGTEAVILGTPALSLKGGDSDWHRVPTSNHVNQTSDSVESALNLVSAHLAGGSLCRVLPPEKRLALERSVLPWPNDLAARRVIAALRLLGQRLEAPSRSIMNIQPDDFKISEEKVIPASFTTKTVSELASSFAADLGHVAPPVIQSNEAGIIRVEPA